jgi:CRP/FNR family transcriptional regulator, cyclic AMP receptor protein
MVQTTNVADLLAERGWLSLTSAKFRKEMLARLQLREFAKGEAIYHAGDPPGGLWVIIDGAVEVELPPPETAPILVHFAVSGFWFGEWPLIHDQPRRMSVVASRPSTLGTVPLADCRAILKEDPGAWRWIAMLSTLTTDLTAGVIADLMLRDPVKRCAALLLRLSGVRNAVLPAKTPFPIYLSQEKLGHLANLSRNSIIPILHEFAQREYIEVAYGSIQVKDVKALTETIAH